MTELRLDLPGIDALRTSPLRKAVAETVRVVAETEPSPLPGFPKNGTAVLHPLTPDGDQIAFRRILEFFLQELRELDNGTTLFVLEPSLGLRSIRSCSKSIWDFRRSYTALGPAIVPKSKRRNLRRWPDDLPPLFATRQG